MAVETPIPKNVAVLGIASSGIAAAKLLLKHGVRVFISDTCPIEKMDFILASNGLSHIEHEAGGHSAKVLKSELIILSPGIPCSVPVVQQAYSIGIPVWSEIELAYRFAKAPILAVTGSTGKSTTISLLGSILKAARLPSVVAGNIGLALSSVVEHIPQGGFIAAELSSFQLETIDQFRPRAAAILNLFKNHLDRYETEEHYYNAKKELTRNMHDGDVLVLNAKDKRLMQWAQEMQTRLKVVMFGQKSEGYTSFWHDGEKIFRNEKEKSIHVVDLKDIKLAGRHNFDNACAAAALAWAGGINDSAVAKGLCSFYGLTHRLEFVQKVGGVDFYNDSKATTAESVISAVSAFKDNVVLIAGGKDKGCDFTAARDAVKRHVKCVVLIGEAAGRIEKEWKGVTEVIRAESLEGAVKSAALRAEKGDVVVLSPGCSSFDMFKNFEHRGDEFKRIVEKLRGKDRGK